MLSYSAIFDWSHFGKADDFSCAKAIAQKLKIKNARNAFIVEIAWLPNVEVTGAARLYRAASVWTAGLGLGLNGLD